MFVTVLILTIGHDFVDGETECVGCSGGTEGIGNSGGCYNMINNTIYACPGEFYDGVNSTSAEALCSVGYHICVSAIETYNLGLTSDLCDSQILDSDKFYATLQSSEGSYICTPNSGTNDVWGCASNDTAIVPYNRAPCEDSLGHVLAYNWDFNLNWTNNSISFNSYYNATTTPSISESQGAQELLEVSCLSAQYCGVMCCKDNDTAVTSTTMMSQDTTSDTTPDTTLTTTNEIEATSESDSASNIAVGFYSFITSCLVATWCH